MTFLAYLAAQEDWGARCLLESLSGLPEGANSFEVMHRHLRATLCDFELAVAFAELECHWREWRESERNLGNLHRGA
jgi:hypothetical protein